MPEHGPVCWWQFLCERSYILPAMCTCATLVSCTSVKRAFVLLGSLSEQTEHREAVICLSVFSVLVVLQLQTLEMLQVYMYI